MSLTLKCTSCLKDLPIEDFGLRPKTTRGYSYTCKSCLRCGNKSQNVKIIFKDNLKWCNSCETYKEYDNFGYCARCTKNLKNTCKLCMKKGQDRYKQTEAYKENLDRNRENKNKYNRELYQRSKERINKRIRDKRKSDPLYGLAYTLRTNISNKLRKFLSGVKERKTYSVLGCSAKEFKDYIEYKFEPWMNWENRGKYNGELNYGWDLDHIIPVCKAENDEEVYRLNHYTNFQPLCSKVNRDIKWKYFNKK